MASNRRFSSTPQYIASSAGNLLNCAVTSLAGPVGLTLSQPYMHVQHVRIVNSDSSARSVTLYKGATGGSTGGTEFAFAGVSVPANSYVDWYGNERFSSSDFLTGVASAANTLTIIVDGEIGLS